MKLHKVRSETGDWDIMLGDMVVGEVAYRQKTETQRIWFGSVSIPLANGTWHEMSYDCADGDIGNSAKTVIDEFTRQMEGLEVKLPVVPVKRKHLWTITSSQVNEDNYVSVAEQFGYKLYPGSVADQVKSVKGRLKNRPRDMAGWLIEQLRYLQQGEKQVTPLSHHFAD